jgi:hypothetical protein
VQDHSSSRIHQRRVPRKNRSPVDRTEYAGTSDGRFGSTPL